MKHSLRSLGIINVVILLAVYTALPLQAASGDLDTTFAGFGYGGKVIARFTTINTLKDTANAGGMALQPDGKIVVAGLRTKPFLGGSQTGLLVMRYLPNGVLDPTFGVGGIFTSYKFAVTQAQVALQADGNIVVVAQTFPFTTFLVTRLTATGALDATFGDNGWRTTNFGGSFAVSDAVLVQPDGKIVAAGFANIDGDNHFAVARYTTDGALDTTFDGDGKMTVGFGGGGDDRVTAMALQDDGKLVLVGDSVASLFDDHDFTVARVNPNGTLDTSFDGDGRLTTGFGGTAEFAYAVAIQPDGAIIVAGGNGNDALLARYLPNGDLDASFDGDGKLGIGGLSGYIFAVQLQPDGNIVLLGDHTAPDHSTKFAMYRVRANGALDTTFDGDGNAFFDFDGSNAAGYALALQADGRILAYGQSGTAIALARLWPDAAFDAGGTQLFNFGDPLLGAHTREGANAMALQPDGNIVLAGSVANAANTDSNFGLARFLPDGQIDTSFGILGRVSYGFGGTQVATAVAIQPDGKIVVGGYTQNGGATTSNFMIARFNADGSADGHFGFGGFNVLDFLGGSDYARSLALAPDGKIVLAGTVFNGARDVFGVARFNSDGTVDTSFDLDGKQLIEITPNVTHAVKAVVVQPDGKIVVGGTVNHDFALVRVNGDGSVDPSFGSAGTTVTDMGGNDTLNALALTTSGGMYAAGSRLVNNNNDFALAHYDANGALVTCAQPCQGWATGKTFVNFGGADLAFALDVRDDGQIFAAGCSDGLFAWAQLQATDTPIVVKGTTAFVGDSACALGVARVSSSTIMLAGTQIVGHDTNMALARFATTPPDGSDAKIGGLSASSNPTLLGATTTFTATSVNGTNISYRWDFGDGTPPVTGANATHTYSATGVFTTTLTATNNQGSVSTIVHVEVSAPAVTPTTDTAIAGLSATSTSPMLLDDPTTFTATIASGTNVTYSWDFGDGTPPVTGASVLHTYTAAGVWTATVTATNNQGSVSTTVVVQVNAPARSGRTYLPFIQH